MEQRWHAVTWKKTLKDLKTNLDGLSEQEVKKRQRRFGLNKLPEEKPYSKIKLFLNQFMSPLIYILVIAGFITLFLEEYTDAIIIFGAVILNTIVGYFQENKASQALRKLRKILKVKAVVFRNGNEKEILQEELVPGDMVFLKSGCKVPADGRLIEAKDLKINEVALTGEWLPAEKKPDILPEDTTLADRDNMVYMGTVVDDGRGKLVVTGTGLKTELGKVAQLLRETKEEQTPYQIKLADFSRIVGVIISLICIGIFIEGMLTGGNFVEMFTTAVAVAVAAVPEGLPVSMTVILALGMQRILEKKGLVRKLVSTETLGSTSVICTDKTATLTEGKMKVAGIYTGSKELLSNGKKFLEKIDKGGKASHVLALRIATMCSEAFIENPDDPLEDWIVRGRPTDKALFLAGIQAGLSRKELEREQPKIGELPFDPVYKYSVTLHEFSKKGNIIYLLGAPELILQMSKFIELDGRRKKMSRKKLNDLNKKFEELTSSGLRVLGTAYKKIKKVSPKKDVKPEELIEKNLEDMVFVGFIAIHDPLRPEVKQAIKICRRAGIRPIIITGDHKLTAKAIAKELGLQVNEKNIIEGKELEKLSDKEFEEKLEDIEIYARVEPRQKLRIVKAWQKRGEVVAMTGDGINDAPALKQADIGVALGSGTDVAKEVSDLILLTDNFSIIVTAVEEGRAIIDNIRKIITYLLSDSFTEVILIGLSMLIFKLLGQPWILPITAAQILWVNLIEDGLPDIALAFEPKEKGLMKQKPQGHEIPLLTKEMKVIIFVIGLLTDFILLGIFFWLWNKNYHIDYIRTMVFVGLSIDSLFYVFSCKSLRQNIWRINLFSNKILIGAWALGVIMLILAIYAPILQTLLKTVPLGFHDWLILFGLGLINLILIETTKWYFISRKEVM
jgi:Ca2+-transporting ATPase